MADFEISKSDFTDLEKTAIQLWKADEKSAKELGEALIKVQKALRSIDYGNFGRWLKKHKIPQNRASYCMRVAENKVGGKKPKNYQFDPTDNTRQFTVPEKVGLEITYLARFENTTRLRVVQYIFKEYLGRHRDEIEKGREMLGAERAKAKAAGAR